MVRTVLVLLWISLVLALAGPPLLLWSLITRDAHCMYATARFAVRICVRLAGLRVTVRGGPRPDSERPARLQPGRDARATPIPGQARGTIDFSRNYVFMANHVSNADPPVCFLATGKDLKIIFKKELLRLPILSTAFTLARCIPLDRSDRDAARRAIEQAVAQLKQGDSFLIFPEGTRSPDGRLGNFKSGAFLMSILSGVPILPITLRGFGNILPKGAWKLNPGQVEVIFHPPIAPPGSTEQRAQFKERVRATIASAL